MPEVISCFQEGGHHIIPSNFYRHEGWTVEHEFQAAKTFDFAEALEIRTAVKAGDAKRLGRRCTLRADWDEVKDNVMLICLRRKFRIPECRDWLLGTDDAMLIEGNTWGDQYWGATPQAPSGVPIDSPLLNTWKGADGHTLWGANKLGILLMEVRDDIRSFKARGIR